MKHWNSFVPHQSKLLARWERCRKKQDGVPETQLKAARNAINQRFHVCFTEEKLFLVHSAAEPGLSYQSLFPDRHPAVRRVPVDPNFFHMIMMETVEPSGAINEADFVFLAVSTPVSCYSSVSELFRQFSWPQESHFCSDALHKGKGSGQNRNYFLAICEKKNLPCEVFSGAQWGKKYILGSWCDAFL